MRKKLKWSQIVALVTPEAIALMGEEFSLLGERSTPFPTRPVGKTALHLLEIPPSGTTPYMTNTIRVIDKLSNDI